jgi:rhomboid protease GluP
MTDPMDGIGDVDGPARGDGPAPWRRPALLALFVLCLVPELILTGSDLRLWGQPQWRATVVQNAGFWSGLLGNWQPNYRGQPWLMFASYGFLHAGFSHFAVNMITLFSLGDPVISRIGSGRFLLLFAICLAGGAAGFAALSNEIAPMVGASGALFGLAGALMSWEFADLRAHRRPIRPVLRAALMLVALNLILWWAMAGHLAWQTHLGGFVAGWVFALWVNPQTGPKVSE